MAHVPDVDPTAPTRVDRSGPRRPARPTASPPATRPAAPPAPPARPVPQAAPATPPKGMEVLGPLRRGVVHQARGDHRKAVEELTRAIEIDRSCAEAWAARALSKEALGDVEGAKSDYATSIRIEVRAAIERAR